jgi:hypothetical protein
MSTMQVAQQVLDVYTCVYDTAAIHSSGAPITVSRFPIILKSVFTSARQFGHVDCGNPSAHSPVAQLPGGVFGSNQRSIIGEPVDRRNPSGSAKLTGLPPT